MFRSALSSHSTAQYRDFADPKKQEAIENEIGFENYGQLVRSAKNSPEESHKLMSYLYNKLDLGAGKWKSSPDKFNLEQLNAKLDTVATIAGDNLVENKKAIKDMSRVFANLMQNKTVSPEVFQSFIISSGELMLNIEKMEQKQGEITQDEMSKYLDIFQKYEGLIVAQGGKDIKGNSLFRDFVRLKHKQEVEKILGKDFVSMLTSEQQEFLLNTTMLKNSFINKNTSAEYVELCAKIARSTPEVREGFGTIVGTAAKLKMQGKWANVVFAPALRTSKEKIKDGKGDVKYLLEALQEGHKNLVACESSLQALKQIKVMENEIPLWSEPSNFEKMLPKFKQSIKEIDGLIEQDKQKDTNISMLMVSQARAELVEVMDLSIKAMSKSVEYESKHQQAENFKKMLKPYADCLNIWTEGVEDITGKHQVLEHIKRRLENRARIEDLEPSRGFDVSTATMDQYIRGPSGWSRILTPCKTLEDCFMLIHQNLIVVGSKYSDKVNHLVKYEYEGRLKDSIEVFKKKYECNFGVFESKLMNTCIDNNHLILEYNIPIRDHSARCNIEYNYKTQELNLDFKIFGKNEMNRWDLIEVSSLVNFVQLPDSQIIKYPIYDKIREQCEYSIQLKSAEDAEFILDDIYMCCELSGFQGLSIKGLGNKLSKLNEQQLHNLYNLLHDYEGKDVNYIKQRCFSSMKYNQYKDKDIPELELQRILMASHVKDFDNQIKILKNLYHNNKELFNSLTSDKAMECYAEGADPILFMDQCIKWSKDKFDQKVEILNSMRTKMLYKIKGVNYEMLSDLYDKEGDVKKFEKKIGSFFYMDAAEYIQNPNSGNANPGFEKLMKLDDADKIHALILDNALKCYNIAKTNEAYPSLEQMMQLENAEKIRAHTSGNAQYCYSIVKEDDAFPSLEQMMQLENAEKIKSLTSNKALKCYNIAKTNEAYPSLEDMMQVEDADKIQALVSNDAQKCYDKPKEDDAYPNLEQMMQVEDADKIQALVSYSAQKCYDKPKEDDAYPSLEQMMQVEDADKIQALVSNDAQDCYDKAKENDAYPSLEQMMQVEDAKKIQALVSSDA